MRMYKRVWGPDYAMRLLRSRLFREFCACAECAYECPSPSPSPMLASFPGPLPAHATLTFDPVKL